jgi:hypothetical protein
MSVAARYKAGELTHQATWVIRDGTGYYATGCSEREVAKAEQALKDYIAKKYTPVNRRGVPTPIGELSY